MVRGGQSIGLKMMMELQKLSLGEQPLLQSLAVTALQFILLTHIAVAMTSNFVSDMDQSMLWPLKSLLHYGYAGFRKNTVLKFKEVNCLSA